MENENKEETKKEETKKIPTNYLIPGAILIAGALIAGVVFYSNRNPGLGTANPGLGGGNPKAETSVDDDPFLGPKNAKVTIIEFSDFQCPFCRSFWRDTFNQIKEKYIDSGKSVKFVYRDFPLSSIHPMAQKYAEAAECAQDQGKFWEMHDKIFQEQDKLGQGTISAFTIADVKKWARELGLNGSEFNQCLDSGKYAEEVKKDFDDGVASGVNGTPTFFINGKISVGAQPFETLKSIIDQELQK